MSKLFRLAPFLLLLGSGSEMLAQGTLGRTRTISGSVVLRGTSVAPVRVTVASSTRTFQRTIYTDGSGTFSLSNVPYGQYTVDLEAEGYLPLREYVDVPPGTGPVMVQFIMRPAPPERTASSKEPTVSVVTLQVPREALNEFTAGQREAQRQRWKEARAHFEKALQKHPEFPQALRALALLDLVEQQPETALERLRRAVEIDPSYAEACLTQSQVLNFLGRFAEALEAARKVTVLRPDVWPAQYELGVAALALGQDSVALEAGEKVEAVAGPNAPEAKLLRAGVWLKRSRYAEAKAELVAFLSLAPDHRLAPVARKTLQEVDQKLSVPHD